jgi:hypothetical protein
MPHKFVMTKDEVRTLDSVSGYGMTLVRLDLLPSSPETLMTIIVYVAGT